MRSGGCEVSSRPRVTSPRDNKISTVSASARCWNRSAEMFRTGIRRYAPTTSSRSSASQSSCPVSFFPLRAISRYELVCTVLRQADSAKPHVDSSTSTRRQLSDPCTRRTYYTATRRSRIGRCCSPSPSSFSRNPRRRLPVARVTRPPVNPVPLRHGIPSHVDRPFPMAQRPAGSDFPRVEHRAPYC